MSNPIHITVQTGQDIMLHLSEDAPTEAWRAYSVDHLSDTHVDYIEVVLMNASDPDNTVRIRFEQPFRNPA